MLVFCEEAIKRFVKISTSLRVLVFLQESNTLASFTFVRSSIIFQDKIFIVLNNFCQYLVAIYMAEEFFSINISIFVNVPRVCLHNLCSMYFNFFKRNVHRIVLHITLWRLFKDYKL